MSEGDPSAWDGCVPSSGTCVSPFSPSPGYLVSAMVFFLLVMMAFFNNVQLVVAELLAGAGLRGECHGEGGVHFCGLGWSGGLLIPWGPVGTG